MTETATQEEQRSAEIVYRSRDVVVRSIICMEQLASSAQELAEALHRRLINEGKLQPLGYPERETLIKLYIDVARLGVDARDRAVALARDK